jgi:hypothetical protein
LYGWRHRFGDNSSGQFRTKRDDADAVLRSIPIACIWERAKEGRVNIYAGLLIGSVLYVGAESQPEPIPATCRGASANASTTRDLRGVAKCGAMTIGPDDLYSVDPWGDPNHDAVVRIGRRGSSEAGPFCTAASWKPWDIGRVTATSDRCRRFVTADSNLARGSMSGCPVPRTDSCTAATNIRIDHVRASLFVQVAALPLVGAFLLAT